MPATPEDLFSRLDRLGIAYARHEHPPLYTVEDSKAQRGQLPGGHSKNLFLRDKKGNMWLLVCLEDRDIDIKRLRSVMGAKGSLSFGSAERLKEFLGVEPGAVTPFAVMNDAEGKVDVLIDKALLAHDPVNFHPLVNTMTIALSPEDLRRFLVEEAHPPRLVDLDSDPPALV